MIQTLLPDKTHHHPSPHIPPHGTHGTNLITYPTTWHNPCCQRKHFLNKYSRKMQAKARLPKTTYGDNKGWVIPSWRYAGHSPLKNSRFNFFVQFVAQCFENNEKSIFRFLLFLFFWVMIDFVHHFQVFFTDQKCKKKVVAEDMQCLYHMWYEVGYVMRFVPCGGIWGEAWTMCKEYEARLEPCVKNMRRGIVINKICGRSVNAKIAFWFRNYFLVQKLLFFCIQLMRSCRGT